ncbi:SRPBCC domain-containing protein [Flavobacterium frigoris]|uniref:Glutathione S-transferase-related transmembrane protein n=1 Tax=Flavobacterium frigoris (strain PS1) TaxID=1086011 RepID=H7FTA2_FLAFP|nr:SRPBCC domain-containing protein [Flavobacterium frigoris]EIA08156.1 putative glutathione S-transferase-related transmembrane protein [Flavobacterium frigoris PS1]
MEKQIHSTTKDKNSKQELFISRIFDASREHVWKAWTDSEIFIKWWGPNHFSCPFCKIDFKVGGKYLNCMLSRDGRDFWSTGIYKEIDPMKRIVYSDSFSDEKGNVVSAIHYGMEELPVELQVSVTFEEFGDGTKMSLSHIGVPTGKMEEITKMSWNESFDKLEKMLIADRLEVNPKMKAIAVPGVQELFIIREFDAPREVVFNSHVDPEIYIQWLGPRYLKTNLKTFEPRSGGKWRYVSKDSDGNKYSFHGFFHEVSAPEFIVSTFEYDRFPERGHVFLEKIRFDKLSKQRTKLTYQMTFSSIEDRDFMLQSGMERDIEESYERLDSLLSKK